MSCTLVRCKGKIFESLGADSSEIDIQEGNIMLSITDTSIFDEVVQEEKERPTPRRVDGDRIVYSSVELDMPDDPGVPVLCDFGDARFGQGPFEGEVMPDLYRAPEIVLKIAWSEKIDIWSFGLMVGGGGTTGSTNY